jgi:hypothetical protein
VLGTEQLVEMEIRPVVEAPRFQKRFGTHVRTLRAVSSPIVGRLDHLE